LADNCTTGYCDWLRQLVVAESPPSPHLDVINRIQPPPPIIVTSPTSTRPPCPGSPEPLLALFSPEAEAHPPPTHVILADCPAQSTLSRHALTQPKPAMVRKRAASASSSGSTVRDQVRGSLLAPPEQGFGRWLSLTIQHQELGTMYDYLAKVILLGPSGTGK
jgi:hypothetical protein